MSYRKEYDVFIAYHGSYEDGGSRQYADEVFAFLSAKGLKCFYFPYSGKDVYKSNILDVMKSRAFILVCTKNLHVDENGRIDRSCHYELSTEIDAFYALTQIGEFLTSSAKVLACGEYERGKEARIHELFANRTHFYPAYDEETFDKLYKWVVHTLGNTVRWQDTCTTNEIMDVFAVRASMKEVCNFDSRIAEGKRVRAIGISNTEMTMRIDPQAITSCIKHGGTVDIVFLDPDGAFTSLRETEEELRPGKIRNITNVNIDCALDMKASLADRKDQYRLYLYDKQPRMNMIFIDNHLFLQYYANNVPGLMNPSFHIERQVESPVFDFCEKIYNYLLSTAKEIEEL